MKVKSIIVIILIIIAVVLIIQNTEVVDLQLLFWHVEMSRIILILLMLGIGMGIGYILATVRRKKEKPLTPPQA